MRSRAAVVPALLVLLVALAAAPAWGYVREVTKSGVPVAWKNPCVEMRVYLGATPAVLSAAELLDASAQAAATWSYPQVMGTDLRLTVSPTMDASGDVGRDDRNVIVFRGTTWCREPAPLDDAGLPQPDCYPPGALAVTSLFKNAKTGELLDTDIEFNAVHYTWGDRVARPDLVVNDTADYQNALTHELGHVIGLDHNCFTTNDGQPRLLDHTGAPAIDCYSLVPPPAAITEATMYPSVSLDDVARRDLSDDDLLGVSQIYPHRHEACPSSPDGGCGIAPVSSTAGAWPRATFEGASVLLAGLALWRWRRRAARAARVARG